MELGSGPHGGAAVQAAFLYSCQVVGIEIVDEIYEASLTFVDKLKVSQSVREVCHL